MPDKITKDTPIGEVLKQFPEGFQVSCSGAIYRIVFASSHLSFIVNRHPIAPSAGGYAVVDNTEISIGDPDDWTPA